MSDTFVQQLAAAPSPFLAGFGQYCLDSAFSDEVAYGQLKRAATLFPEVREELTRFPKEAAGIGDILKGGMGLASNYGPKLWAGAKGMMGMGAKVAPTAAPAIPRLMGPATAAAPSLMRSAAPAIPGVASFGSRMGGAWQGAKNLAANPAAPAVVSGGMAAMGGYQQGGLPGALTQGAIGAVGGAKGGWLGGQIAPTVSGQFNVGGMAQGATQMGQRAMGMGSPTFNTQINPQTANYGELGQQLGQGIGELNNASSQWKDNSWSGGRYGQAVSNQRSKLYGDFRTRAQALGAPQDAIESTLAEHTPRVAAGADPHQMWQQLQDPETRQLFQQNLAKQQQDLLASVQAGKPPEPEAVKSVLMGNAAHTAASQGLKPDELVNQAKSVMADVQQNGITAENSQKIFGGPQGKALAQSLIDKGNVRTPQELMQTAGEWMTQKPMEAGMMLLGIPMALWGMGSMLSGNGGVGSLMALLGGGAMAAYGGGVMSHLTGGQYGSSNGLMQAFQAPKAGGVPASIPLAAKPGAGTMAAHYSTQAATPEGAQQSLQSMQEYAQGTKTPYDDQIVGGLTPETLPQLSQSYMQDPHAVREHAFNQIPSYQRPFAGSAFNEGWNSLRQHLDSPRTEPGQDFTSSGSF